MSVPEGLYNRTKSEKYAALRKFQDAQDALSVLELFLTDKHPEVLEEFLDTISEEKE